MREVDEAEEEPWKCTCTDRHEGFKSETWPAKEGLEFAAGRDAGPVGGNNSGMGALLPLARRGKAVHA